MHRQPVPSVTRRRAINRTRLTPLCGGERLEDRVLLSVTPAPPLDIGITATSISENSPVGTVVGALNTTDPNTGDTFNYALVSGAESTDNSAFRIVGNQLRTAAVFDFEAKSTYSVRVQSMDQDGLTCEKAFTIRVTNQNDKPLLTTAASPALTRYSFNGTPPVAGSIQGSTPVSSLIDLAGPLGNFSDVDGDLPGIAIVSINLQRGRLWYSTDSGAQWREIAHVSDTSATLLYADNSTRLYFAPASEFDGAVGDLITFRAWDRTGGFANGATGVNTLINDPIGRYDTGGSPRHVDLTSDGRYAYVPDYRDGLLAIDVSDPSHPTLVGAYSLLTYCYDVALSSDGKYAFVADGGSGLRVIDVSNPARPTLVSTYDTNGGCLGVTASSDARYVFVADGGAGLRVIDVSNPARPTLAGTCDTPGSALQVAISSDKRYAFVTDFTEGLQVIDISTPTAPKRVGGYNTRGYSYGVVLSLDGRYAFVADDIGGLQVIDVSTPTAPTWVGEYQTSGLAWGVTLSSDGLRAFVADGGSGVQVIDVSTPTAPKRIGGCDTSGSAGDVVLSSDGRYAFVADGSSGLQVIDVTSGRPFFSLTTDTVSVEANHAPSSLALSPSFVYENAGANAVVGLLSTTDPDSHDTFTFSLITGVGDDDNSSFAVVGNRLVARASFNFEAKSTYSVRVQSMDQDGLTFEKTFTIAVADVLEGAAAPQINLPARLTVTEDLPTPLEFGGTLVTDADSPLTKRITVTLAVPAGTLLAPSEGGVTVGGTPISRTFTGSIADVNAYFNLSSARIFYRPVLNSNSSQTLTATVFESYGKQVLKTSRAATISVLPVNDAPLVSVPASFIVTEDTRSNLVWPSKSVPFSDVDSPTLTVTLAVIDGVISAVSTPAVIVGGTPTARTFSGTTASLNAYFRRAGAIAYTPPLDATTSWVLTTTVSDGLLANSATSAIRVTPVNDAPTVAVAATLRGALSGTPFEITYDMLRSATKLADVDHISPSLIVTAIDAGTIQRWNGSVWVNVLTAASSPLLQRTLSPGQKIRWIPPLGASRMQAAFRVQAWDGLARSATIAQIAVEFV